MTSRPPLHRYLIPFCDDSTLIFASRLRRLLQEAGAEVHLVLYQPEAVLSERQIRIYLPDLDYSLVTATSLMEIAASDDFDAVLTSRVFRTLNDLLRMPAYTILPRRAKIVAFLGGLDFFPEKGRANRQYCDAVYLFPRSELTAFETMLDNRRNEAERKPLIRFGHPAFLKPATVDPAVAQARAATGDIYFFTQAISPSTERGRTHMLNVMKAIARANPDRKVWIKLRHLPDENTTHLHRERHSFPALLAASPDNTPPNLLLTDCTMEQAMENCAVGITCTSTAAIDLVREGIPTIVHLDYIDYYVDKLVEPMRRLFADSGLIKPLEDLLELRYSAPDPDWMESIFCERTLAQDIMSTIDQMQMDQRSA